MAQPGDTVILQVARNPTAGEIASLRKALGDDVFSKIQIVSKQTDLLDAVKAVALKSGDEVRHERPIRKELMTSFERELHPRWPQFKPFDSERDRKTWAWKISPRLVFFVTVQAMERADQFVVEVSWNETENFPWGAMGKLAVDQPQGRERLNHLAGSGGDEPVWDVTPEKTAELSEGLEALRDGRKMSIPATSHSIGLCRAFCLWFSTPLRS